MARSFAPRALALVAGSLAIAAAAQVSMRMPGTEIPQTGQTLAVLLVGATLGRLGGALAVVLYVALGATGLPVFAGGASGPEVLAGPTAGYLAGFLVAAIVAGWWVREPARRRLLPAFGGMLLAHAALLALGWSRLAIAIGAERAFLGGVAPFLVGAVIKSLLAAIAVSAFASLRSGAGNDRAEGAGGADSLHEPPPPLR